MKIVLQFTYDRTTKNTHRFEEVVAAGTEKVVGSLYIQKSALGPQAAPDTLKVTVEA